jgi:hypothetical protein
MRNIQRIILLAGAVAVLIVGFVLASSGGSSKTKGPPGVRNLAVTVAGGKPVGGVAHLEANKGDTINLTVRSNVADEIHIHGYDLHKNVPAGGVGHFTFKATIDGNFVIELESRAEQIASLTVKT